MPRTTELRWDRQPAATAMAAGSDAATAWDALNRARRDLPFMTAEAMALALASFGRGDEQLLVGRAVDGGEPQAMLIGAPLGGLRWQTFQPSQMPLGAWVALPGHEPAALAAALFRGPLRHGLGISLTQNDPWLAPREADGDAVTHSDYIATGWIDIEGGFDAYWEARGKNLKQNMRKQRTKLAAEGTPPTMRTLSAAADMAGAIERYAALESVGWKADRGTAIGGDNPQAGFYRSLLEQAARRGEAVVYEGLFGERTVSMNLCLRRGPVLVVLKTTYDESIRSFSPAFLLNQDMVQALFAEGQVRRMEYYGKLMDWHTKWTDNQRTLYHTTAYRWPFLKRLAQRRQQRSEAAVQPPPQPAAEAATAG